MHTLSISFELIFTYEPNSNKPRFDFAFSALHCSVPFCHKTVTNTSHIDRFTDRIKLN